MRKTLVTPKEFIQSGFTSPADEYAVPDINLDHELKVDPEATYPARMEGDAMEKAGIPHGSRLLFQRGVTPKNGDIVYFWYRQEKWIRFYEKRGSNIKLYPSKPGYEIIQGTEGDEIVLIGVITWSFICHIPRLFPNVK